MPINVPLPGAGAPVAVPIPQLGALPAMPSAMAGMPNPMTQFMQALGQAPQDVQDSQLAKAKTDAELQRLDDQKLAQLAQFAQSNPQYASSPRAVAAVEQIYKKRKLPPPIIEENGQRSIDVNALLPGKPFGTLSQQEVATLQGLPQDQRRSAAKAMGVRNAPEEFFTADPYRVIPPGAETAAIKMLSDAAKNVADPKGGGPQMFMQNLRTIAPIIAQATNTPKEAVINEWTSNPELLNALNARAETETQALVQAKILTPEAAIAYKQKYFDNYLMPKLKDTQEQTAIKAKRELAEEQKVQGQLERWKVQNQKTLNDISVANKKLETVTRLAPGLARANAYHAYSRELNTTLTTARAQLAPLRNLARAQAANGGKVDPNLTTQMDALQKQIDELYPQVKQVEKAAADERAQYLSSIPGMPVKLVPPRTPPPASSGTQTMKSTSKSGRPIESNDGGVTWHYLQ